MSDIANLSGEIEEGTFVLVDGYTGIENSPSQDDPTRLGLIVLASRVKEKGTPVVLTPDLEFNANDVVEFIEANRDRINGLVGISLPYTEVGIIGDGEVCYNKVYQVVGDIRNMGLNVVLGGPGITLQPRESLSGFAEELGDLAEGIVALEGEGDLVLPDFVAMTQEERMQDDRLWRVGRDGGIMEGELQVLSSEQLRQLPPPDYDFFYDLSGLSQVDIEASSRGCRYRCFMCSTCGLSDDSRSRSYDPEDFVGRLRSLSLSSAARPELGFVDSDFCAAGIDWVEDAVGLIDEDPSLKFLVDRLASFGYVHPKEFQAFSPDDINNIRSMGVTRLGVGIQAASADLLKSIGRGRINIPNLVSSNNLCRQNGIHVRADMIWGLPGFEDYIDEEFEAMIAMTMLGIDLRYFKFALLPGSRFYDQRSSLGDCSLSDEDIELHRDIRTFLEHWKCFRFLDMNREQREKMGPYLGFAYPDRRVFEHMEGNVGSIESMIGVAGCLDDEFVGREFDRYRDTMNHERLREVYVREGQLLLDWYRDAENEASQLPKPFNNYRLQYLGNLLRYCEDILSVLSV